MSGWTNPAPLTAGQQVVLFIGGSLMPFCRFRRSLIELLLTRHDCRVICVYWGDSEDGMFRRFEMPGLQWINLGGDHASPPGPADLRPLWQLFRLIRQHRPDVICCFNAKPIALAPLVARLAWRQVRIVALMEGLGTALSFLLDEGGGRRRVFRSLTRVVQRWITLNPRDAALARDLHPHADHLVLSGIGTDLARFHPGPDPLAARRVIFVGRLVPEKGIGFFVDLARYLGRQHGSGWRFAIAGIPAPRGPITPDLVRTWLDDGHIESCDPVHDMASFYQDASILIFPSEYHEGLPAVLMEAQASGLPCLVLDTPAIRGAIIDGESGFLLPDHDPALWAARLEQLSDPGVYRLFSMAARRHACAFYDQDRTNARLARALLLPSDGGGQA